ncbi:Helix-loop-helix DNA-binding domain protein [Ancylostoma caninum]|uniref:Helix-loop-helix DNA-binding domain protein n=1 Tax=Ancylostoma caninum TaxID=29170 RepID=A0A368GWB6_ANCCA|nr:Helix-loop-helix DNA-binding domain protein [Ancylostoma caninum]
MQLSYPSCFHYSYPDSDAQSSTLHTPLESPAYPSAYPPHQEHSEQQVKREKRKYRCRKRSPATIERARIIRRDKANARERRRMNNLNDALEHLRTILPSVPDEPKMTKIETLRVAQGYITYLSSILADGDSYPPTVDNTPYTSPAYPAPAWQSNRVSQ